MKLVWFLNCSKAVVKDARAFLVRRASRTVDILRRGGKIISGVKKKPVILAVAMVVLCSVVPAWASGEVIGWGRQVVGPIGPVEQTGIGVIS